VAPHNDVLSASTGAAALASAFAIESGPLYTGGLRRPGPNLAGFDPFCPNLDPAEPPPTNTLLHIQRAIDHWDRETYEARNRTHPELLWRGCGRTSKQRGTKAGRELRVFKRGDRTVCHHRFARFLAAHSAASSNEVGLFTHGELRSFRREEIADRIGCSLAQVDRLIRDFVAAGLIYRRQGRELDVKTGDWKGRVAVLKVTRLFWIASGSEDLRQRYLKTLERQRRRAEAAPRLDPSSPIGALVANLARSHADTSAIDDRRAQIRAEHPTWKGPEVLLEAKRRMASAP
jgi:hypothetical protein